MLFHKTLTVSALFRRPISRKTSIKKRLFCFKFKNIVGSIAAVIRLLVTELLQIACYNLFIVFSKEEC